MSEKVFFDDRVNKAINRRFVERNQTYAIANITLLMLVVKGLR